MFIIHGTSSLIFYVIDGKHTCNIVKCENNCLSIMYDTPKNCWFYIRVWFIPWPVFAFEVGEAKKRTQRERAHTLRDVVLIMLGFISIFYDAWTSCCHAGWERLPLPGLANSKTLSDSPMGTALLCKSTNTKPSPQYLLYVTFKASVFPLP